MRGLIHCVLCFCFGREVGTLTYQILCIHLCNRYRYFVAAAGRHLGYLTRTYLVGVDCTAVVCIFCTVVMMLHAIQCYSDPIQCCNFVRCFTGHKVFSCIFSGLLFVRNVAGMGLSFRGIGDDTHHQRQSGPCRHARRSSRCHSGEAPSNQNGPLLTARGLTPAHSEHFSSRHATNHLWRVCLSDLPLIALIPRLGRSL